MVAPPAEDSWKCFSEGSRNNNKAIPSETKDNLQETNTQCFLDTGPDLKISTKHIFSKLNSQQHLTMISYIVTICQTFQHTILFKPSTHLHFIDTELKILEIVNVSQGSAKY